MSEREIFTGSGERVLDKLLSLKREVLQARRMLGPLRDTMNVVVRRDFPNIRPECRIYFLDLYDHLIRLFDICDTQRELLSSAMEAHLSQVSNRLNEVMKVLTIMSTILMPMTLISGIYGMNFRFMPELNWRFGYPWALGLMLTVSLLMLAYFRRRKWL
jgi:magnesium transporter